MFVCSTPIVLRLINKLSWTQKGLWQEAGCFDCIFPSPVWSTLETEVSHIIWPCFKRVIFLPVQQVARFHWSMWKRNAFCVWNRLDQDHLEQIVLLLLDCFGVLKMTIKLFRRSRTVSRNSAGTSCLISVFATIFRIPGNVLRWGINYPDGRATS